MYNYISGEVVEKTTEYIIIDINGIGYEIRLSKRDLQQLHSSDFVKIFTYLYVREDEMSLFGLLNRNDKSVFLNLLDVSGIGVKSAIGILSTLNSDQLISALESGDINIISKCPGVGKKTAQRIVLELKGKLVIDQEKLPNIVSDQLSDAYEGLKGLGFTDADIKKAFNKIDNINTLETTEIVKAALKMVNNA